MTATPTLNRVTITREENRPDLPLGSLVVRAYYDGVDRPEGVGIGLNDTAAHMRLAERLKRGIEAGVVNPVVGARTDVNGKTYAETRVNVIGRTLNADLKRLGF